MTIPLPQALREPILIKMQEQTLTEAPHRDPPLSRGRSAHRTPPLSPKQRMEQDSRHRKSPHEPSLMSRIPLPSWIRPRSEVVTADRKNDVQQEEPQPIFHLELDEDEDTSEVDTETTEEDDTVWSIASEIPRQALRKENEKLKEENDELRASLNRRTKYAASGTTQPTVSAALDSKSYTLILAVSKASIHPYTKLLQQQHLTTSPSCA